MPLNLARFGSAASLIALAVVIAMLPIGCSDDSSTPSGSGNGAGASSLQDLSLGDPLSSDQINRLAQQGQLIFTQNNCQTCHTVEPNGPELLGPPLASLPDSTVELTTGGVTQADDQYIYNSIVYPNRQLVAGYDAIMPNYERLSERERLALVYYIRSLTTKSPKTSSNETSSTSPPQPPTGS